MKQVALAAMMAIILVMVFAGGWQPVNVHAVTGLPVPTATPLPLGSTNAGWVPKVRTHHDLDLVWVPAGCFLMGSDRGDDDELPRRTICLSGFWMGQTEITNRQYARCVQANACSPPHERNLFDDPAYADHPVVMVDWEQAAQYARWRGCSLPLEAQWEYAARGPEGLDYPWGTLFDGSHLNFCDVNCDYAWRNSDFDDGYARSAPAGYFSEGVSWVGAFDMGGNVWEWVADWYDARAYTALRDGMTDPSGPPSGIGRVVRGGSWASAQGYTRASSRDWDSPHLRFVVVGFRVTCPLPQPGQSK